jgi:mono/diheme cytochrome c family protein
MSELLSAAAAALGLPEGLVQRSAEARAAETGASVDDILAAWAGGETVGTPSPAPAAEAPSTSVAAPAPAPPVEEAAAAPEIPTPSLEAPAVPKAPASAEPYEPPVLIGGGDNPLLVLVGAVALFVVMVLVGLVGPSIPTAAQGARTSEISFTTEGEEGRALYTKLGCAACHTQMVRPVVADVGLGAVTLNDTNRVLGTRRFGPDLADVGSRLDADELRSFVEGSGGHPGYDLSDQDLSALVAYLSESRSQGAP